MKCALRTRPAVGRLFGRLTTTALAIIAIGAACTFAPPGTAELDPAEVTSAFYRWYLGYPGNVVVDEAYLNSPYLAESFVARVANAAASDRPGGGDPFLLAQDIPERFEIGESVLQGDHAAVTVRFYWQGNDAPVVRTIRLVLEGREWRIEDVELN